MPLSVLAGVDINLSSDMMAAGATTYSNLQDGAGVMKRRFWEEDDQIFGGHLLFEPADWRVLLSPAATSRRKASCSGVRERSDRRPSIARQKSGSITC
jgi:monoamine oxidase